MFSATAHLRSVRFATTLCVGAMSIAESPPVRASLPTATTWWSAAAQPAATLMCPYRPLSAPNCHLCRFNSNPFVGLGRVLSWPCRSCDGNRLRSGSTGLEVLADGGVVCSEVLGVAGGGCGGFPASCLH